MQAAEPVNPTIPENGIAEMLRLAGPNIVTRLGIMTMGLTDAIVVGHFSSVELGYHALGWAPTIIVLVASIGLLFGVQVMAARHVGSGHPERTGAVLRRGLEYALLLGLGSTVVLFFLGPFAMDHMGLDADLATGSSAALKVFSLSLTPYLLANAIWFWLEAVGKQRVPMAAMWVANAINLALALWVVPGHSPFPVTGAVGAGWVTLVARLALLAMLAVWVWRWPEARALGVFRKPSTDRAESAEQRRIGYAAGLSAAIETSAYAGMNFVAGQLGVLAVASWAIILNIMGMVFMIPMGIAAATAVMVSRGVGGHSTADIKRAFYMGQAMSLLLLTLLAFVVYRADALVVRIYTDDPALLGATMAVLWLAVLCFIVDGPQAIAANALRARGDIWWATGMHFLSYMVVMLPLGWWLGVHQGGGLMGIVEAIFIASVISSLALCWRFLVIGDAWATPATRLPPMAHDGE